MDVYIKTEEITQQGKTLYGIRRQSDGRGAFVPATWTKLSGWQTADGNEIILPASRVKAIQFMMLTWL
jgi:hypothetical protein